jgi:L-amino acid N-acyltransferase YncA
MGSQLVAEAMRRVAGDGASTLVSYIGETNHASIALHRKLGFERDAGPFMTWRKPARPA